jgi:hypothetical protein
MRGTARHDEVTAAGLAWTDRSDSLEREQHVCYSRERDKKNDPEQSNPALQYTDLAEYYGRRDGQTGC